MALSTLEHEVDDLFARPPDEGVSLAFVLTRGGEIVAERYGVQPGNLFQPDDVDVTSGTPLLSWSVAKSMVHAAVGIIVLDGRLDPADPAPVPAWRDTNKAAITVLDLLEMRPGLRFVEDYVDGNTSHCLDMLFGSGAADQSAYAAALPLDHPPGTVWNYSSGTTNIICRVLGDLLGGEEGGGQSEMRAFLDQRLFGPSGMFDAEPGFDARRHVGRIDVRPCPGSSVRPLRRAVPAATGWSVTSGSCRPGGSTTPAP